MSNFVYVPPWPAPVVQQIDNHRTAFIGIQSRAWSILKGDVRVCRMKYVYEERELDVRRWMQADPLISRLYPIVG
jgi:hypothetical protein